jgi:SAM-dependent methyltransferase
MVANATLPLSLLRCPDCGDRVATDADTISCAGCGRAFTEQEGVLGMLPGNPRHDPRKDDPEYQRWLDIESEALEHYFEHGNVIFNWIHHSSHRIGHRYLDTLAPEGPILDLGCGAGAHFPYYREIGSVVGVDLSGPSLRKVASRYPDARVVQGDATAIPLRSQSMAAVMSIYNLEHVYFLDAAIDEIARVLRTDGVLVLGLPCEGGLGWSLGRLLTSQRTLSRRFNIDYRKIIRIEHCNTARFVHRALERRFRRIRTRLMPLPFLPIVDCNLTITSAWRLKTP